MSRRKIHKWTEEQKQFVKDNIKGTSYKEMQNMLNVEFNLDLTIGHVSGFLQRNNLGNGVDPRLKKGHEPWNKGKKGLRIKGSEKGWFEKGVVPPKYRQVGSERVRSDGLLEVKVANPSVWKLKHRYIWEQEHGEIPDRHVILFKDGDHKNVTLENLFMVKHSVLVSVAIRELEQRDPELNVSIHKVAELELEIKDREERQSN